MQCLDNGSTQSILARFQYLPGLCLALHEMPRIFRHLLYVAYFYEDFRRCPHATECLGPRHFIESQISPNAYDMYLHCTIVRFA